MNGNGKNKEVEAPTGPLPPYLPFRTFLNFLQKLKDTVVPERIDGSLLRSYPGSVARHLKSTLKYMGLIDEAGNTKAELANLVKAYGTESWREELSDLIARVYLNVIGDLNTDTATLGQLQQKFRAQGAESRMLQKCIAFYLTAGRECGWSFSPHFTERAPRRPMQPKQRKKNNAETITAPEEKGVNPPPPADGNSARFSFPVPGKTMVTITVPADLTTDDWEMINSMMTAYVQRREKKGKD